MGKKYGKFLIIRVNYDIWKKLLKCGLKVTDTLPVILRHEPKVDAKYARVTVKTWQINAKMPKLFANVSHSQDEYSLKNLFSISLDSAINCLKS